jgi:O-antigen ligase
MFLFYWLIGIMPLDEHPFWGREIVGGLTIVKILGLTCLPIAAFRLATRSRSFQLFRTAQARWYLALFLLQCSAYFFQSGKLESGSMAYSHVFSIFTIFLIVFALVDSELRMDRTLLAAIAAVAFASLYAIRQAQKYGDTGFRPSGMFQDSNEYALVADLWLPLAFLWILSSRPLWERILCCGAFISALMGSTLAASRGGLFGLAVSMLYLVLRSRARVRNSLVVAAVVIPILVYSPVSAIHRLRAPQYGDQLAEQARIIVWKAGLKIIREHPLAGVGLHNFKPRVADYELPGENVVSLAHNTYIEVAAELGVPALVAFVSVLLMSIRSLELSRRRALALRSRHLGIVALGLQAGLISFMVSAFFVTAWWEKMVWLMIFATMAVDRISGAAIRHHESRNIAFKSRLRETGTLQSVTELPARAGSAGVPARQS